MEHAAKIYTMNVTFSDCLCTPPHLVTVLDNGQAIAHYNDGSPPMPYNSLLDLLECHAQGPLTADQLRAAMKPHIAYASCEGSAMPTTNDATVSKEFLQKLTRRAKKYYGEGAVQFTLPS